MSRAARLRARAEALPAPYLTLTLATGAALSLAYLALRALFGGASAPAPPGPSAASGAGLPLAHASFRVAVISLLTGFTAASALLRERGRARDRAALAPLLPERMRGELSAPRPLPPLGHGLAVALGAGAGMALVLAIGGAAPRPRPTFDLVWALAENALLFALMAHLAYEGRVVEARFRRAVTERLEIDLLDPAPLVVFARRGLRNAAYWMIGSAIASLLFLSFGFDRAHAGVLAATLAVGAYALLEPVVGIHRRLAREREDALARVRRAVARERDAALAEGEAAAAAASRLPGLLALEARLERADTWPFDASTALRFAALGALAVGSWLGGAVVERLLGLALG